MNEREQRIAIAKACGWRWDEDEIWSPDGSCTSRINLADYRAPLDEFFPDYLHDLNAMHEAWKTLPPDKLHTFEAELDKIVNADYLNGQTILIVPTTNATAAQRAEAFLRTIGKWIDD